MKATWSRVAPWVSLTMGLALFVGFAVTSHGYPINEVTLHDSGIWVVDNSDGQYGRMNMTAAALDGSLTPGANPSHNLDIYQDGESVVAVDFANGQLIPVDPVGVDNVERGKVMIDPDNLVAMGSGSMAVIDVKTGNVWAIRYPDGEVPDLIGLDSTNDPLANLGAPPANVALGDSASLAISSDGTVYAISTTGTQVVLVPDKDGGFADAQVSKIDAKLSAVTATCVGTQLVYMDPSAGTVYLPNATVQLPDGEGAVLQQAGPMSSTVFAATMTDLYAVPLAGGSPVSVASGDSGMPARPVVVGAVVDGAWAGAPGRLVQGPANGSGPAQPQGLDRDKSLSKPVFRVNHGFVCLNDTDTGRVFDLVSKTSLDDWKDLQKPTNDTAKDNTKTTNSRETQPKAVDDHLGARAGRTTVLHVLDNDTDPGANILAITQVTQPSGGGASTSISADGQTVLFLAPDSLTGQQSFDYTISNGLATASAHVTVTITPDGKNSAPMLRSGAVPATYPVASNATVGLFVTQDWRDPDGDPVSVVSASTGGVDLPVSPQGKIYYTAPQESQATDVVIDYQVTDGNPGVSVAGKVSVHVLGVNDSVGVAPIAQADFVRGIVGVPVTFAPLANDIPGADPRDTTAQLALVGSIDKQSGLSDVVVDPVAGTVTVIANVAGNYTLDYSAGFGSAGFSQASVRLEIAPQGSMTPVAVPDQVTVRGQVPATVDVLGNDIDPSNSVLTVTEAEAEDSEQLSVAVFDGRWVRIQPLTDTLSPNPQIVHYSMTNGLSDPVQGDVTVTQVATPSIDGLILNDDHAVVRCGDTALIDVLANDASTSGKSLVLDEQPDPTLPSGQLPAVVVGSSATGAQVDAGQAFVVGNRVRYVAPTDVSETIQVAVTYAAATADGGTPASATLIIDVRPQPSDLNPDSPPQPQTVEARAVSGDTKVIPIPIYGVDPDGDSVTVAGIASAPTRGRILSYSPTAITYQAFPTDGNNGTDTFTYVVQDKYGATGVGTVRVGLAAPGLFPPSVAIDDTVTAQPGAAVFIEPMVNDLIAVGDDPIVVPVGKLPAGVSLSDDGTTFIASAPANESDPPLQFSYLLRGVGGDGPSANVTIKAKAGFENPPRVYDAVATIESDGTAVADPLATAWDVDGPTSAITLVSVSAGTISGGKVAGIPVTDQMQAISYVASDADGNLSSAVIFVPPAGAGAPELIADVKPIQMDQNSSLTVNIADYVFSPRDRSLRIALADTLAAAPGDGLTVQAASTTSLTLTSVNDYVGPAAISVEIADGDSTDDTTLQAYITIPVQVGPPTPVLRCPTTPQKVIQGGDDLVLDITAICHVWAPDDATAASMTYTATWPTPLDGVSATDGRNITVSAAGSAMAPSTGQLQIGVADSVAVPQMLAIEVVPAPKPKISVPDLVDIAQGSTVTQTVVVTSPLRDAVPTIISVTQTKGPDCQIGDISGMSFTLTPGADVHGVLTFQVVASDLADQTRVERQVTTTFTMTVYGKPEPPSAPQPGKQVQTHAVTLTWTPGADNGAAIDTYEVQTVDGAITKSCGKMTTCNVTGLTNGQSYQFQVRAHNKKDWSDWSAPSPTIVPNEPPGKAPNFAASDPQDGHLTLTWDPAPVDGTPVTVYHLSWSGGTSGSKDLSGTSTSYTVPGLDNDQVTSFTLVAENQAGPSKVSATTQGQSSGRPLALQAPTITPKDLGDTAQVTVSWPAADPNGPGPITYQVTRSGGSAGTVDFAPTTSTKLGDSNAISYDGTKYTYTITATNATGGSEHTSAAVSSSWSAIGNPANWDTSKVTITPTGSNGQVTLAFAYPAVRGAKSTVTVTWPSSGSYTVASPAVNGGTSSTTVTGLTNANQITFSFKACNESSACTTMTMTMTASQTPFGPLAAPSLSSSAGSTAGDHQVCVSASANGNGRNATLTVTNDYNSTVKTASGTGSMSIASYCFDAGAGNKKVTFTAKLVSDSTSPSRANPTTVTSSATTPADPPKPSVKVAEGTTLYNYGHCNGTLCRAIIVTGSNFTPGQKYTVNYSTDCAVDSTNTCRGADGQIDPYTSVDVYADSNGNISQSIQAFGYPGSRVWVTIAGYKSNVVTWK